MNRKVTKMFVCLFMASLLIALSCKKTTDNPESKLSVPKVTTDSVYYNHSTTALCKGTMQDTGAGNILRFGFCWSKTPKPVVDNPNSTTINSTSMEFNHFYANIQPILYGNVYYVRAFASNNDGVGYGNEIMVIADTVPVIVLDGYYIKGPVTAYPDLNSKSMMKITYNETNQHIDPDLFELYLPIKAGAAGFSIVKVDGSARNTFGAAAGFGVVTTPAIDEPKLPFQRGPVSSASTTVFTVPADGFYHVVFDTRHNKAAIMRVVWGMIGAATPSGWSTSTVLTESAFNLTAMSYTLTDLTLDKGDWKFRYSDGWKVEMDTTDSDPTKWVKVNTNLGGAADALIPGGANIINTVAGIYTVTLTYTLGSGYSATLTKTGNIPPINYSTYQMGIIGDAYTNPDGTPGDWTQNFGTSLPAISGTDYTWTYTIDFIANKDFRFRQGYDWSGKNIGYHDVTMAGPSAANFTDDGGNFKVTVAGNYTMVLKIAAATETYTVTATKK